MLKLSLSLMLLFFAIQIYSQDSSFTFRGKVIDFASKTPLAHVGIQINGTLRGTETDSSGHFTLFITGERKLLKFSLLGYETVYVNPYSQPGKEYLVPMKQKARLMSEVSVTANAIQPMAKSKRSYVLDYDFYNDDILLISYGITKSSYKLVLINEQADTLSIIKTPEMPVKLFKDCLGNHYIVCEENIYQVYYDNTSLRLLPPKSIKDLENVLLPCIAQDSSNLYLIAKEGSYLVTNTAFHDFYSNNTSLTYYFINKEQKLKKQLLTVVDEETLRMKADERRLLDAKEQGRAGDAQGRIMNPKSKSDTRAKTSNHRNKSILKSFDIIFSETIVFKEIFAPLYVIKGKLYVFDFVNSKLQSFSPSGDLLKESGMTLHKDLKWKRYMCIDETLNKAYTLFEKNGISELKEIDLKTGKECHSEKIPLVFAENIKINNGSIYFLHKGQETDDTRYLSKLKIH